MNTVNASTGFSPFQLRHGRSPRIIPTLTRADTAAATTAIGQEAITAQEIIDAIDADVMEAQDNLLLAKSSQMYHANRSRADEIVYAVDNKVLLSTFHRRRDYMRKGDNRVAK
ncbi:hypothetical protein BDW22DRAFT_1305053, partial [Trametopsis cervina]